MNAKDLTARLRAGGSVFAEDESRLLIEAAASGEELERLVLRRLAGEPLEVIVGWAGFCGQRVAIDPGVFVPRARTGILVEHGSALINAGSVVVDVCCGSGAIGMALQAKVPGIGLWASDIDSAAVRCARRNLAPRGGQVCEGDLMAALPLDLRGRIDLLVVNAPYVPTDQIGMLPREARHHEPTSALDGGADGVSIHRRIAAEAAEWLAPDGRLLIETSAQQSGLTSEAFAAGGLVPQVLASEEIQGTAVMGHVDSRR